MSKILVTGGAGFIGSNLVDRLIEEDHEVVVLDNLSSGSKENLNPKAKFIETDITKKTEIAEIFKCEKPEVVFHLAAQASVVHSVANPSEDININLVGTVNLLKAAVDNDCKNFIFSSTGGAIYGEGVERPTPESAKEQPVSPYGINKLAAEFFVKFFQANSNMQAVILRYANVYGPRQNSKGEAGVVAIFATRMLQNDSVSIFGDGDQTRDYVYVGDIVEANIAALNARQSGTYNIATGKETTVNELARIIKENLNSQSEINYEGARSGELRNSSLDSTRAFQELEFEAVTSIEEGLKKTIQWYKDNN